MATNFSKNDPFRGTVVRATAGPVDGPSLGTCVVIDVLRATTTAAVIASRRPSRFVLVGDREHVRELRREEPDLLIFSEYTELQEAGEWYDNSPRAASTVRIEGRTAVLVTTNGTKVVDHVIGRAERVLLASFVNLDAVVRRLRASAPERVTILPSGGFEAAAPHVEDEALADILVQKLAGEDPDAKESFPRIRDDARIQRRLSKEPGLAADLDLALTPNLFDLIPVIEPRASERWLSVRTEAAS